MVQDDERRRGRRRLFFRSSEGSDLIKEEKKDKESIGSGESSGTFDVGSGQKESQNDVATASSFRFDSEEQNSVAQDRKDDAADSPAPESQTFTLHEPTLTKEEEICTMRANEEEDAEEAESGDEETQNEISFVDPLTERGEDKVDEIEGPSTSTAAHEAVQTHSVSSTTRILSVVIHTFNTTKTDMMVTSPLVCLSLIDGALDEYPATLSSYTDSSTISQRYEGGCVYMTAPASTETSMTTWEECMVFDVDIRRYLDARRRKTRDGELVLIFELLQPPESFSDFNSNPYRFQHGGFHRIAWAFMTLTDSADLNSNNLLYDGQRVRLQLYDYIVSTTVPNRHDAMTMSRIKNTAYHSWKTMQQMRRWRWPKRNDTTLDVTLRLIERPESKDIINEKPGTFPHISMSRRGMLPMHREVGRIPFENMADYNITSIGEGKRGHNSDLNSVSIRDCYRDPKQPCHVPNSLDCRIEAGSRGCSAVKYSPSGDFLVAIFSGEHSNSNGINTTSRVILFDSKTYSPIATFVGHHELVYEINWDNKNVEFVTSSADFTAKVWSINRLNAGYSDDSQENPTGSNDGSIIPLAAEITLQHPCFVYTSSFHPRNGTASARDWPQIIITGAYDRTVRLWNRKTGIVLCELSGFEGCINAIATDTFGKRIYVGDGGGALVECACKIGTDVEDGEDITDSEVSFDGLVAELKVLRTCTELLGQPISSIKLHNRGRRLLVLTKSLNSTSSLNSGTCLVGIDMTIFAIEAQLKPPICSVFPIRLEISPDGRLLICGSEDGRVIVWSLEHNKMHEVRHIRIHNEAIVQMSWHPTEHRIAACAFGAALPVCIFAYEPKNPLHMSRSQFSKDGSNIKSGGIIGNNKLGKDDLPKSYTRPLMLTNRAATFPSGDAEYGRTDFKIVEEERAKEKSIRTEKEDQYLPSVLTPTSVSELVQRSISSKSVTKAGKKHEIPSNQVKYV